MSLTLYGIVELILKLVELGLNRRDILDRITAEKNAGLSDDQISEKLREWRDESIVAAQKAIDEAPETSSP